MAARSGRVSFAYDPLGRLYQTDATVSGGAITRFGYDGVDMIAEYNSANALQRRYVHGPGTDNPIVWYEGSGTADKRFLHADERGSIVAVSNASGGLLAINTYDEYGIPRSGNVGRFQYTGQTWLPEAGLFYYKARMYSPTLGRFMQTDPIGYADGMNWYAYVGNDPVNATDPSGLKGCQSLIYDAEGNLLEIVAINNCSGSDGGGSGGGGGGAFFNRNPGFGGGPSRNPGFSTDAGGDGGGNGPCPTPARLSSLDGFIDGAVGAFNGSADAGPVPLPADLIKAMVGVESGYNQDAYMNDPLQVNVPGDWDPRKSEWSLVRGSAPGQAVGIVAGIGWLSYKAFRYDSTGSRTSFLGWEAAAVRYNGGGDPNYLSKVQAARARISQGC